MEYYMRRLCRYERIWCVFRERREVCLDHEECGIRVVGNEFGFPFGKGPSISNKEHSTSEQNRENILHFVY